MIEFTVFRLFWRMSSGWRWGRGGTDEHSLQLCRWGPGAGGGGKPTEEVVRRKERGEVWESGPSSPVLRQRIEGSGTIFVVV